MDQGPQAVLQLAFVAQRDDDPGPLRDLTLAVLDEDWPDADWLTLAVPRHGAGSQALEGVPSFQMPVSLLAVTRAGTNWNNVDFRTQRCGVEHVFL